ncbi:MAG: hypothetical protein EA352_01760 [Gemmatimonadales bacterium]|nr:MAG: hypothetical protein EA352_01760 [Gemmatimonadales bacterium]
MNLHLRNLASELRPARRRAPWTLARALVLPLVLAPGVLTSGGGAEAQEVERILSDAASAQCTLVPGPEVVIGDGDDNYLSFPTLGYAVNSRGHLLAVSMEDVREFDAAGNFVQTIGRLGEGPGEFQRPLGILVGPEDSAFVFHRAGMSVYDAHGEPVRDEPAPTSLQGPILLESGAFVNQASPTAASRQQSEVGGPTIHVHEPGADQPRSFGPETVAGHMGAPAVPHHAIAPSGGNSFWMAPRAPYRVERWSAGGELEFVLEREAAHHPRADDPIQRDASGQPVTTFPYLSAVGEDAEGRLWTAVIHELEEGEAREGESPRSGRSYDSIVEVLDPGTGELLGSARLPGSVTTISRSGHLVAAWEGPNSEQFLRVWQPTLEDCGGGSADGDSYTATVEDRVVPAAPR